MRTYEIEKIYGDDEFTHEVKLLEDGKVKHIYYGTDEWQAISAGRMWFKMGVK